MKPALFACAALLLTPPVALAQTAQHLDALAERVVESADWHERVQLAQTAKRRDAGGSLWWFEIEIRARRAAGEPAAVARLCTQALTFPLTPGDQAVLLDLRAEAYAALGDDERAFGDTLRAANLTPDAPARAARAADLIAERLEARRTARALREAREWLAFEPESAEAALAVARAAAGDGQRAEAIEHFMHVLVTAPAALPPADALHAAQLADQIGEAAVVLRFLDVVQAEGTTAELDGWRATLEAQLADAEAGDEFGYGGMGYGGLGYGEWDEDAEPPRAWTTTSLAELADRAEAALVVVDIDSDTAIEESWALEAELAAFEAQLQGLDSAAIQAQQPAQTALIERIRPVQARNDQYAVAAAELNDLGDWMPWIQVQVEDPDTAHFAAAQRIAEAYWTWYDLPLFTPPELLARAEAMLTDALASAQARDAWEADLDALLSTSGTATPVDNLQRAQALLATGTARPELLLLSGLAQLELGQRFRALPRLHLGLAQVFASAAAGEPSSAPLEHLRASVATALADLRSDAETNAQAARLALDSDLIEAARGFAERAADLAPYDATCHALEGEVLLRSGDAQAALRAYRIASNLSPNDERIAAAHGVAALEARAFTEALDVAERRVNASPRDPSALLQRALARALLGHADRSLEDRMFAYEMSGREQYDQTIHAWTRWAEGRSFLVNTASLPGAVALRNDMPWVPSAGRKSPVAEAIAEHVFGVFDGQREVAEIGRLNVELAGADARAWPGVAAFYRGEIERFRGVSDQASRHFAAAIADPHTPTLIANLAAMRLDGSVHATFRPGALPIHVPKDVAELEDALRLAQPGQTIVLDGGTYSLKQHLTKSVRIVGAGVGATTLQVTAPYRDNPGLDLFIAPKTPTGAAGWVELADLSLYQFWGTEVELGEGESRRVHLRAGTLALDGVRLQQGTALAVAQGATLTATECDWSSALRDPLVMDGGAAYLDQVVLARPAHVQNARLEADRLTLVGEAALDFAGASTTAAITSLTTTARAPIGLLARDGAMVHIGDAFWRAAPEQVLMHAQDNAQVHANHVLAIGHAGAVDGATQTTDLLATTGGPRAATATPLIVEDIEQLESALTNAVPWIQVAAGEYVSKPLTVRYDTLIEALPDAAAPASLLLREDWGGVLLQVTPGVELTVRGVHLGTRGWYDPPAGSALAKHGAKLMVDPAHDVFTLVRNVGGTVWLDDVSQVVENATGVTARVLTLETSGTSRTVTTGLVKGSGLRAAGATSTWALDGGFTSIDLQNGATATLVGRGQLKRLDVAGPSTRVVLDDLRPERVPFVAFREGARDPRSEVRRARDGVDPLAFQTAALERATATYLVPLNGATPRAERAESLASYGAAYASALRYSVAERTERDTLAARALLDQAAGDTLLLQALIAALNARGSSYGITAALYRDMAPADYHALIGRNRAEHELGADASEAAIERIASWEEALLAGQVTPEQMRDGKLLGMNVVQYHAELRRRAAEVARREQAVELALASGNRDRIKRALKAYDHDRWLEYIANDGSASLDELNEAIASGTWSQWYGALVNARNELEAEQWNRGGAWSGGSSYGASSSSSGSSNEFQGWLVERANWNKAMDLNLEAISNSSYSNYRNSYDY